MATRRLLVTHDTENNVFNTKLQQKGIVLPNKGISRRPALTDLSTNRDLHRVPVQKPVKKDTTIIAFKDKKLTKPVIPVLKDKNCTKQEEKCKKIIENPKEHNEKKKEVKKSSYSVHHFGLIEENDTDPLLVPCYINDIICHLRNVEREYLVHELFLVSHKTTARMRTVLVNWLVEVHLNFKLVQETLYLCVSIVDRYLQKNKTVGRDNLQLVGIAALFVASKYEETYAPEIDDLVYICDESFSKKKILQMEQSILKTLDFKFGNPCSLHFLRRYSKLSQVDSNHHILAKYFIELTLIEHTFSHIAPSLIAAAAVCMAVKLLKISDSDDEIVSTVEHISGYSAKNMGPVIKNLAVTVLKMETSKYQTVRRKYASTSNGCISSRTELKNGLIKKLADVK